MAPQQEETVASSQHRLGSMILRHDPAGPVQTQDTEGQTVIDQAEEDILGLRVHAPPRSIDRAMPSRSRTGPSFSGLGIKPGGRYRR